MENKINSIQIREDAEICLNFKIIEEKRVTYNSNDDQLKSQNFFVAIKPPEIERSRRVA